MAKNLLPGRHFSWFFNFGITKDRDYFVENLSMLVASGMTITGALDAIGQEVRSKRMKRTIAFLREQIDDGSSLSKALEKSSIFPVHAVSLIRIGEESGKLSENLKVVSEQQEKDRIFKSKILSAMMYPVFVLVLTLIVGIGIAWFILPKLAVVFSQLHIKLPLITKILIAIGNFLGEYGNVVMPALLALLAIAIYFVFYFPKTKILGQVLLFSFPGAKQLIKEVELARFGYLAGTLLEAGLTVTQTLESLRQATTFENYKKLYAALHASIEEGNSFQKSFASYKKSKKLVPIPIQQLIFAGEQSGSLSGTFLKIGKNYEEKTETTTKNLTVILEPILLVIVWLGVVAVALAVILPIYSLIGNFKTQ